MKARGPAEADSSLAEGFDRATPGTLGAEEELMLLRPGTFELAPEVPRILAQLGEDERYTEELPASQIEIRTRPCRSVSELSDELARARVDLATRLSGAFALAGAGVHPLAPPSGELNDGERYRGTRSQLGDAVLERQLVFAFQVHVVPGDAECALAVYNALRSYLPELAGLAANAPFLAGEDTRLASVRPQIGLLLPRQGVPPVIESWESFADDLAWGTRGGLLPSAASWWWELRPRPAFGTLEVRVPDTQTTVGEAARVAALVHCLSTWLAQRHRAGEHLSVHSSWRIAENRWLAAREGIDAELADLDTGVRRALRDRIRVLVSDLAETATELGCAEELEGVEDLLAENGAARQRRIAAERGVERLPGWLASRFLEGCEP